MTKELMIDIFLLIIIVFNATIGFLVIIEYFNDPANFCKEQKSLIKVEDWQGRYIFYFDDGSIQMSDRKYYPEKPFCK